MRDERLPSTLRRIGLPALAAGGAALLAAAWTAPHAVRADRGPQPRAGGEAAPAGSAAETGPTVAPRTRDADARGDTTVVGMTNDLSFTPEKVTIRAGGTVVWRNSSVLVHTVTAVEDSAASADHVQLPDGAEPFGSGRLAPDESYRRTFTVPGTYRYFCIPHEAAGMTGVVVVRPEA